MNTSSLGVQLQQHGLSLDAYVSLSPDLAGMSETELTWHLFRHGVAEGRPIGTEPKGAVNIERILSFGVGLLVYGWSDQEFNTALLIRQRGHDSSVEMYEGGVLRFWRNDVAQHFGLPERTIKHGFIAAFHFPRGSGKSEAYVIGIKERLFRIEEAQQSFVASVPAMMDMYRYLQSMMVYDELLAVLALAPGFVKTISRAHADAMQAVSLDQMYASGARPTPKLSVCAVVLGNPAQLKTWAMHVAASGAFRDAELNVLCNGTIEYDRICSVCRWLGDVMGMNVRLYLSATNIGFNHAMNRLVRLSTGKYIFCTNTDVRYKNFAVDRLFQMADRGAICVARQFNSMGALQHLALDVYRERRFVHGMVFDSVASRLIGRNTFARPADAQDREVDFFGAAAFLGSATLLRSLGPFDPGMVYAYHEDTDLAIRAKQSEAPMIVTSAMDVIHYESSASQVDMPKAFMIAFNTTRIASMLS